MRAKFAALAIAIGETFWILPGAIIVGCAVLALALVALDHSGLVSQAVVASPLVYSGDATGARTLLGAVASSTISVAGTIFSITIAALTLAAGQMGPRLLRNFTRDRGNQITLGILLGTFTYALLVLRTVRGGSNDTAFTPHISLSVGVLFALISTATLVFFVGHIAGRINVDTVIDLVASDVDDALARLTTREAPSPATAGTIDTTGGQPVRQEHFGFLQHLDAEGLADWAAEQGVQVQLLVRPGDYVYPGVPIATVVGACDDPEGAITKAIALGRQRISAQDLEFAIRQLEEVAVRALSPGINDPHTAMNVLQRLGAALCILSHRHLATGCVTRGGKLVLTYPSVTYDGLTDQMFHLIRQNIASSVGVSIAALDALTAVARVERRIDRLRTLRRHADLWISDTRRMIVNGSDLADVNKRYDLFVEVELGGANIRTA